MKTETTLPTERDLFIHGWIKGKRKNGTGTDWLYLGNMQPFSFKEAQEITRECHPEIYGEGIG